MKTVRLFHRRFNYNSTSSQRAKCVKSLRHSLRLKGAPQKELEWDESLSKHNLIYLNGIVKPLDSLDTSVKERVCEAIAPRPRIHNKKQIQQQRVNYKSKLKRAVKTLANKGYSDASELIEALLKDAQTTQHLDEYIYRAETLDIPRKKQRLELIRGYVSTHRKLSNLVSDNSVWVQEGIIKIPHQWEVSNRDITLGEYLRYTETFLTEHFPDFRIKAIVGHDDERLSFEDTGAHIHYFIDGRNTKTGEYTLHKAQLQKVNEFIQRHNPSDALPLDINQKLSRKHAQIFGEYFQKMLYQHINEHLLIPKMLCAEFSSESERRSERRKEMEAEARLPKSLRKNNFHNRSLEKKAELALKLDAHVKELTESIEQGKQAQQRIQSNTARVNQELSTLEQKKNDLEQTTSILTKQVESLNERMFARIGAIIKHVYMVDLAKQKGDRFALKSFMAKIRDSLAVITPEPLHNHIKLFTESLLGHSLSTNDTAPSKTRDRER